MTIVELFDDKPINNIVGALAFSPEKIIYVGGISKKQFNSKKKPVLEKYLWNKSLGGIEIEYMQVNRSSLSDIVLKLEFIYSTNTDLRFHVEVTGGEDLILIALGILCERHPEIELYQISSKLRTIRSYSLSGDDGESLDVACSNMVRENLFLHGASIVHANGDDVLAGGFRWTPDFLQDISVMWKIMCDGVDFRRDNRQSGPNQWNRVTAILAEIDKEFAGRMDANTIEIDKHYYNNVLSQYYDVDLLYSYLNSFVRKGLIERRKEPQREIYRFKNDQIRLCLTKSGLLLELKVYLICSELVRRRGGDCLTSVTIDWDGDDNLGKTDKYLSDPDDPDSVINTINEVDVVCTCGLVPYFISCKNGKFTSDELFKLSSVAEQFGKGYGRKIIVATNLSSALQQSKNLILQRAADMGITIIDNVSEYSDEELCRIFADAMELPKAVNPAAVHN